MTDKQWQYGMNIVFGLMLFFLPWLLGFETALPIRSWDFFVIGAAIVAFALLALHKRSELGSWANLLLGAWMIVSPWILGFSANMVARDGAILLGALVFLLSLWARFERRVHVHTRVDTRAGGHA